MSRGLGKVQKGVLRHLGIRKWKSMAELVGDGSQGSEYMSMYRAVKTLESRGLIETKRAVKGGVSILGPYYNSVLMVRKVKS